MPNQSFSGFVKQNKAKPAIGNQPKSGFAQFVLQQQQEPQAPDVPVDQPVEAPRMATGQAIGTGIKQGFSQAGQAGVGALKSIPAAADNFSGLGQRALRKLTSWIPGMPKDQPIASLPKPLVTPKNDDQRAGFLGGQIAQTIAVPENKITAGATKVTTSARLGKLQPLVTAATKALTRTATGAGISKVEGATDKQAKTAGLVSGGLSLLGSAFSPLLKSSANKSMAQALGATTKDNKAITEKVVPELIQRKTVAMTQEGLFSKAVSKADKAGDALETGYSSLPANAQTDWKPVLDNLQKAKDELTVNGVVLNPSRYKALDSIQQDLMNVVGSNKKEAVVSVETARKVRQILDKATSQKSKIFGLTGTESDALAVQKIAANSIRSQLASEYPDIAKLNKEFNFWSNVQKVVGDTIRRTRGQVPLGPELAQDTGAVIGATRKGNVGQIVGDAFLLKLLKKATTSTGWRTTSAVTKSNLANFLATGDVAKATVLLQKVLGGKSDTEGSQ